MKTVSAWYGSIGPLLQSKGPHMHLQFLKIGKKGRITPHVSVVRSSQGGGLGILSKAMLQYQPDGLG